MGEGRIVAKKFSELRDKMSAESRARSHEKAERYRDQMALDELRAARELTQESLAEILGVKQAAISKIERRTDMYLSTLQNIIKAMGGSLSIRARFPDGEVEINQFKESGKVLKKDV
jgi:DNA-binding XRE family transcriptional regulator